MARTERESARGEKRNGRLVGAAETSKELAEWSRHQRKNLSILGLLQRKEWPRCHRESSWQVHRSRLCQKEKEQSRLSKAPNRIVNESQDERERSGPEHGEERVDFTVKKSRFQRGEGGQTRRVSLGEVEGSMSG